jgi:hypothetical protein
VHDLQIALLWLFAEGRGENPDGASGILIIVGSIVVAIAVVAGILVTIARRTRR